jgi:hypothetical protein
MPEPKPLRHPDRLISLVDARVSDLTEQGASERLYSSGWNSRASLTEPTR